MSMNYRANTTHDVTCLQCKNGYSVYYDWGDVPDNECPSCDAERCDDCSTYCQGCPAVVCKGCSIECTECGERFCVNCSDGAEKDYICDVCKMEMAKAEYHDEK